VEEFLSKSPQYLAAFLLTTGLIGFLWYFIILKAKSDLPKYYSKTEVDEKFVETRTLESELRIMNIKIENMDRHIIEMNKNSREMIALMREKYK
jgi:hypothetical protein